MSNLSQTEKALSKGAGFVKEARSEVKNQCIKVDDQVKEMMGGWGGQGATAFGNLMVAWQEKQNTILTALDQLAQSMEETEKDNVATDQAQSDSHATLQNRLG